MGNWAKSFSELIGNTPLLALERYGAAEGLTATLLAKLELFNPAGSVKDRAACKMIRDAEARGSLTPGATIVEPTSGNMGLGLAAAAVPMGYRVILTMPDSMSIERRKLLSAYGAELVLTEGAKGMKGAIAKAEQLLEEIPGAYMPRQFENPANPLAHYRGTGPEIWRDTEGDLAAFVAGVGTGGTLSGVGRYLKEQNRAVRIVAVEPAASPVLSQSKAGPHKIQGIGAGFVPKNLDMGLCDEVIAVEDQYAFEAARNLARREGILVGISSGAALWAAVQLSRRPEYAGENIVVLLPDTGERYLSTALFDEA